MSREKDYEVKPAAETGWVGWQTALGATVAGLLVWQGVPEIPAVGIGSFAGATSRPVLGYLFAFLPQPPKRRA